IPRGYEGDVRQLQAVLGGHMFENIQQIKDANEALGHFWFSKDTMKGFDTRIVEGLHYGHLFIYSDRNYDDTGRDFKIAYAFNTGHVERLDLDYFPSLAAARAYLNEYGARIGGYIVQREDNTVFGRFVGTIEEVKARLATFKFSDATWRLVSDTHGTTVIDDIGKELANVGF